MNKGRLIASCLSSRIPSLSSVWFTRGFSGIIFVLGFHLLEQSMSLYNIFASQMVPCGCIMLPYASGLTKSYHDSPDVSMASPAHAGVS
ncbi:hypothetical protein DL93DRAFT_2085598 [Clavulina sp. PMI_390]|nr:hypothetical protein DL93DRAFT_2085598 [Clavulina sp. PMI_390]